MSALPDELTIGELGIRSGVATSALRFYETMGLIRSRRTSGNQRRYPRAVLRQVAVIRAAQVLGLSLSEIQEALAALPNSRTPTKQDWTRMSQAWRAQLEARIQALEKLRVDLAGCIGCGCLSLDSCALFNRNDEAASQGVDGSRLIVHPK
jgi:MerR family redox-sensitive transcriptional activator SoxR